MQDLYARHSSTTGKEEALKRYELVKQKEASLDHRANERARRSAKPPPVEASSISGMDKPAETSPLHGQLRRTPNFHETPKQDKPQRSLLRRTDNFNNKETEESDLTSTSMNRRRR